MRTFKKILASLMVAVMILTTSPLSGFVGMKFNLDWLNFDWLDFTPKASAEAFSGTCGDNLTWIFDDETGELIICGTGAMQDYYYYGNTPWYNYSSSIEKIVLGGGITSLDDYAFRDCINVTSVIIPKSVTSIGDYAFLNCPRVELVVEKESYAETYAQANNILYFYMYNNIEEKIISVVVTSNFNFEINKETYTMTINRIGNMIPFANEEAPWAQYKPYVKHIIINDGCTSISENAFKEFNGLESIVIPEGVTSIGNYAFYNCYRLVNITIPDSTIDIGANAFYNCSSIKSITIPDNVTSIGKYAFYGCTDIMNVTIGNGVDYIKDYTFYNCNNIKQLTMPVSARIYNSANTFYNCKNIEKFIFTKGNGVMPGFEKNNYNTSTTYYQYTPWYISRNNCIEIIIEDGVTNISHYAFYQCSGLTSIIIGDDVTSVGSYAFYSCSGLTSVTIGKSVETIGVYSFNNCSEIKDVRYTGDIAGWCAIDFSSEPLYYADDFYVDGKLVTDVVIPEGVTSIGNSSFYGCTGITSVIIPDSVTNIGTYAFYDCQNLTSVSLGSGVESIGDAAFFNCTSLERITIPNSVTSLGNDTFYNCVSLTEAMVSSRLTVIGSRSFYNCKSLVSITIPNSVVTVGSYAFNNCKALTELILPNSVTYISDSAFEGCSGIASVTFGSEVTGIGAYAFKGCEGLTNITIPDSVEIIGAGAFEGCSGLTKVIIGNGTTDIYSRAFYDCSNIKELILPVSAQIYNSEETFYNCTNIEFIMLTKGTGIMQNYGTSTSTGYNDTYYKYTPWYISRQKCTEIIIEEEVTNIGSYAFYDCTGLINIEIPNSITTIGYQAFYNCNGLTHLTLGSGVTNIGGSAFKSCKSLVNITMPEGVKTIEDSAFSDCTSLENIIIPESVESLGAYAFKNCTSLTSIKIPQKVTIVEYYTFYGCTSLTNVTISEGVININWRAFENCINLESVILPISVQSVGNNAFSGCQKIKKLKVYNRKCTFGSECTSYYTTIVGYAGSTAETYAIENGYDFELIPDDDHDHLYSYVCDGECNICGFIRAEVFHTYLNGCDPNCDICGDVRTSLTHTFDNDCDTECNYCDFIRTPNHTDDNNDGLCDVCEKALSDILVGVTQNFKVKAGETVYIKFVPANSGVYTFYSSSSTDTYGYIFDVNKNQLASDDDAGEGNNFSITYTFKSGTVYYLGVKYYSSSNSGEIPVTIRLDELICDHNNTHEEHQDSTCTENGYDKVVCDDCSQTVSTTELPLLDHDYKTITAPPTCVDEGVVVRLCKVCRDAYISEILDPLGHSELVWKTVVAPTTRREGTMNHICPACDEVFDTKTIPAITLSGNSTANVDFETNTISGFDSGSSSIGDYLSATNNGYTFTCESDTIGTGTVITLTNGEDLINEYEAVIFGDVNGDSWYDGQDAIIVDCLANGMLTKDDVGEAVYMAADCNHDGVIDQFDVDLLNQAGTLLANVDQSKPAEVLLETSSAYVEYLDLIDQTPEVEVEDDEATEDESDASAPVVENSIFAFFSEFIAMIQKLFDFILSFVNV